MLLMSSLRVSEICLQSHEVILQFLDSNDECLIKTSNENMLFFYCRNSLYIEIWSTFVKSQWVDYEHDHCSVAASVALVA